MKKLHFLIVIMFTAFLSSVFTLSAQSSVDFGYTKPSLSGKRIIAPNFQADKHFRNYFKRAINETWVEKEDGYRVRFYENDIRFMIDYNKKGEWISTIKSYDETLLSKEIANAVMTQFLGYSIVHVIEIHTKKVNLHLVKIENKYLLKTVRVINGEMDVLEEYRKG